MRGFFCRFLNAMSVIVAMALAVLTLVGLLTAAVLVIAWII